MLLSKATRSGLVLVVSLLLSATAQASNYSNAVNSYGADLLSYWQFNGAIANGGTATDSTGQRNGTYNMSTGSIGIGAGIPFAGFGANQSLQLSGGANVSGTADGVSNDLPSGNSARTYTAWINTSANSSTYRDIFYYGSNGSGNSIFTLAPPNSGDSGFGATPGIFGVSTYGPDVGGTSVINDGNWHFVAFTVTPTTPGNASISIYVDGVDETTATVATTTTAGTIWEMGDDASLTNNYNGLLAQVAVFNSALTGAQILDLYDTALAPEPSSLVALCGAGAIGLFLVARRRRKLLGQSAI
jgi:Concanavalin A-like lectin/glucanases superfamily